VRTAAAPRFDPADVRLSELARCARQAAYRGLGATPAERDRKVENWFERGHLYEDYVHKQLVKQYGADDVERERPIPWPHGVGHADFFIRSRKWLVEVKTTTTPFTSKPLFEQAVQQLRCYLHFDPEAETGALYLIDPNDLLAELEELVPVGVWDVDGWQITRTRVVRQPRFDIKLAKADGFPTEALDPYMRPGSEHDRWAIRAGEFTVPDSVPDDYGEVPF
jgi:hypothetical protein